MFSLEIRVNSQLIGHIYCRNITTNITQKTSLYKYNYYRPEEGEIHSGQVEHYRDEGIEKLIKIILENMEKK